MVVRRSSLRPTLNVQLSQRLAMTPSLLQKIELLTLSRVELSEMLSEELASNPVLEEAADERDEDSPDWAAQEADTRPPASEDRGEAETSLQGSDDDFERDVGETLREMDYYFGASPGQGVNQWSGRDDDSPGFEAFLARIPSLYDHLETQVNLSHAPEKIREVARYLVGNLNEEGYLLISLEEAAASTGASLEEVRQAQEMIKHMDPLGVGSLDLRECLLVQASELYGQETLPYILIQNYLAQIQQRKFKEIARELGCSTEEVTEALAAVRRLAPKPGLKCETQSPRYVQPDIYIYKTEGLYGCLDHPEYQSSAPRNCPVKVRRNDDYYNQEIIELCGQPLVPYAIEMNEDGLPKLRLSQSYRDMLRTDTLPRESRNYIREKWRHAQELLKSVDQRKQTIYRVCCSIVRRQMAFLDAGVTHLKPMLIKDLADELGVHSSTISRAVTNKYVHTPQGVMELRSFFTVGVESASGDNLSIVHVKHKIREIIDQESTKKPLSDQKIANMLNSQGIQITRRTVAKYRDQMKLLGSRERRNVS